MINVNSIDEEAVLSYLRLFGSYYVADGETVHMSFAQELIKRGLIKGNPSQVCGLFVATEKVNRTAIVKDIQAKDLKLNLDIFSGFVFVEKSLGENYEGAVVDARRLGAVTALSTRYVYKNFWQRLNGTPDNCVIDVVFKKIVDGKTKTQRMTFEQSDILQIKQ